MCVFCKFSKDIYTENEEEGRNCHWMMSVHPLTKACGPKTS